MDVVEKFEEVQELIRDAADKLKAIAKEIKRNKKYNYVGYDMPGNMEAYVINYLVDGFDCIDDKINEYKDDICNKV